MKSSSGIDVDSSGVEGTPGGTLLFIKVSASEARSQRAFQCSCDTLASIAAPSAAAVIHTVFFAV